MITSDGDTIVAILNQIMESEGTQSSLQGTFLHIGVMCTR
jgi:hypothetical protein